MSIMPGIENRAPERHDTSSGFAGSPKRLPVARSRCASAACTPSHSPGGGQPPARYALHASVVTTKPGGTGSSSRVISARLAPLPPSSAFIDASPSDSR